MCTKIIQLWAKSLHKIVKLVGFIATLGCNEGNITTSFQLITDVGRHGIV